MEINPFKTEEEYETALEVEWLPEIGEKTSDTKQVECLLSLLEVYEDRHYPISQPNLLNRFLYFLRTRRFFHP